MARVEEAFALVECLNRRFDDVYDRAEELSALVAAHTGDGVDVTMLMGMLKEAQAEKKAILSALRSARQHPTVLYPTPAKAQQAPELWRVGTAGGL